MIKVVRVEPGLERDIPDAVSGPPHYVFVDNDGFVTIIYEAQGDN